MGCTSCYFATSRSRSGAARFSEVYWLTGKKNGANLPPKNYFLKIKVLYAGKNNFFPAFFPGFFPLLSYSPAFSFHSGGIDARAFRDQFGRGAPGNFLGFP